MIRDGADEDATESKAARPGERGLDFADLMDGTREAEGAHGNPYQGATFALMVPRLPVQRDSRDQPSSAPNLDPPGQIAAGFGSINYSGAARFSAPCGLPRLKNPAWPR
jgi:hypothetical protein